MMKNKKAIAMLLLVAMLFSIMPTVVFAETGSASATTTAYVTIVDQGEIVVAHKEVTVTTGSAIIDDFLHEIHDEYDKAYITTESVYGLCIATLWDDSSGNFGYWVNDASAGGLNDVVQDGDNVVAYITQKSYPNNESYTCFDLDSIILEDSIYGAYLELELSIAGYDSSWNTIFTALKDENVVVIDDDLTATILKFTTDSEGKVGISFPGLNENESEKKYFITVEQGEDKTIVPPVCEVTVKKALTAEDNEKNAQSKAMKKITNVITSLNANTPIVAKNGDNLLTAINNIINDGAFTVVLDENTDIYDSNGIITETDSKGAVNVQATIMYGNVTKSVKIPVLINGVLADSTKLLDNIASSYVNATNKWNVMDMGTYSRLENAKYTLATKQNYVNTIISKIQEGRYVESDYATEVILPLTSIGIDATELYPKNSKTPIDAIKILTEISSDVSAWVTPYTLMAYKQGYGTVEKENELLTGLLALQDPVSGSFAYSVDSTGEILATLAFYRGNSAVENAITNAIRYLSTQVREDGVYTDGWNGYNANSTAMAIIGLAAVYDKDNETITTLFEKSVQGLLSFAVNGNTGFWKAPNTTVVDAKATEQGFRALIAASQVMKTGQAFNVYDFSGNTLNPGYEKEIGSSSGSGGSYVPKDDKITVKVSIKAIDGYWMQNKSVTLEKGATASDALLKAIKGTGIAQEGAEDGYIESMEYNGVELGEFTHGDYSGWMYKVNGTAPNVGVTSYVLSDSDGILFYFTEDYTKESMDEEKDKDKEEKESDKITTTPVTEVFGDVSNHWASEAIQYVYDNGILRGVSDSEFAPEATFSRAMIAAVLHRLAGSPDFSWSYPFKDVSDITWYAGPVAWAHQNQLVGGMTETTYAPENPITREQFAVMLMRYAAYCGYDTTTTVALNRYADANSVSDYAQTAMQWAVSIGLIHGRTADTLAPQGTATRAEVSVMLERFMKLYQPVETNEDTK